MSHNPFIKPKPNPKRAEPRRVRGRIRLSKPDRETLRRKVAFRAGERCETCKVYAPFVEIWALSIVQLVGGFPGELSHKHHGANKSDTMEECLWECRDCHRKRHNAGGKPCNRKPGRRMNQTEALAYWKSTVCFCGGEKHTGTSFCPECWLKLSPQAQLDLMNTTGSDYLQTLALAEKFLLAWKPAEERTA